MVTTAEDQQPEYLPVHCVAACDFSILHTWTGEERREVANSLNFSEPLDSNTIDFRGAMH